MNSFHALKFTYFREFIYVCHVAKKSLPRHLDIVAWLIAPLWLKDTEKGNVVIINYSCVSKWAYDELTLFEKRRRTFFVTKVVFFSFHYSSFSCTSLEGIIDSNKKLCSSDTKAIVSKGYQDYTSFRKKEILYILRKSTTTKKFLTKRAYDKIMCIFYIDSFYIGACYQMLITYTYRSIF